MPITRRRVLTTVVCAGALAAPFLRPSRVAAADGTLETKSIVLNKNTALCSAPWFIAHELLRAEGFTEIRLVDVHMADLSASVGAGSTDFTMTYASLFATGLDRGAPLTILAGVMVGCFELFANEGIRSIGELKGKTVGVQGLGGLPHTLVTLMAAQVGLDPKTDIQWVTDPKLKPIELFAAGKIDAFLGFPPEPQELRARKIGHAIVNTAVDRPWSQYFCCLLAGNRDFVRKYPVATKRVVRAILKAADLCATEPALAAQKIVNGGVTNHYDYALQTMQELPYDKWHEYDPEDTLRFYALRLHEVGLIKSNPQKLVAGAGDWRFLNELKRELKA
jgi:NitT/TauT family transport system substrate-binding protein